MTDPIQNPTPAEPVAYTAPAQPTPYTAPASPTPYTAPVGTARPYNVLSIIAIIGAFVFPIVGIIVGFIALNQIKRTGEQGHGLALAGVILGFVFTLFYLILIVASVILPLLIVGTVGNIPYTN
jgi:hypothetical protein